jgi:uncharacterized membrane protein
MLPNPLHPAVVHFPIVLMFLVPIFAAGAIWAIARGARPTRAWAIPLALAASLSLSALVAVKSGEQQSERVERVVGERPMETHEEGAERFLMLSFGLLVIATAGLIRGRIGTTARVLATVGGVALAGVGARVGHTGGQLAYQHGGAAVYAAGSAVGASSGEAGRGPDGHRDRRESER